LGPFLLLLLSALMVTGCQADNAELPTWLEEATSPVVGEPVAAIQILLLITVLSLAPAILVMVTSFTRIVIVLSLTRTAVGMPQVPPNQVVIGLALFLTLFTMSPTLDRINREALQPYVAGEIGQEEALRAAEGPLRDFMLRQTREKDIALMVNLSASERPRTPDDLSMTVLIPAFSISELRSAFQIGALIFVPFLIIDMVVASTLMSMGMMMLPPSVVSLPFKLLLFVMVDGWHLVVKSLLASFG